MNVDEVKKEEEKVKVEEAETAPVESTTTVKSETPAATTVVEE